VPGLKNKIQAHLDNLADDTNIFWYIKFNIPLDETSVSEKTMNVTDTDGYLMRTEITYDDVKHVIQISPLDTYEQEVFYILRISKKVRSKRGHKLKSEIYILFKLMNNQISEFKTLKSNVQIPSVQKRPKNYDAMFREKIQKEKAQTASRIYSFDDTPFKEAGPDRLPTAPVSINILVGIVGIVVVVAFIITRLMPILYAGLAVCGLGLAHIIAQIRKREMRAVLAYNAGVRKFNKERYDDARYSFKKAALFDPHNEMVEYANNKMTFYT
jgi:hypothetical protein